MPGMSTQPQPRIDAGVPDGGRFAPTGRRDAGTDVLGSENSETPDVAALAAALANLPLWSRKSAGHWGIRRRVSVEDLQQEVMVQFLQTLANKRRADGGSLSGRNAAEILNPAYVHATARRVAANMAAEGRSSIEQAALRLFRGRREDFSTEHGRELTHTEQDTLAAEVRESFPPGDRPAMGFHRQIRTVSMNHDDSERNAHDIDVQVNHFHANMLGAVTDTSEFAPGSTGQQAMHAAEAGGKAGQAAIEDLAWNSLAEQFDAPLAQQGTLANDREVAKTRKEIRALTDSLPASGTRPSTVLDAVNAWENGDLGDDQMEPIFRPFGGARLTADECDRVARVLKLAGHQRSSQLLDLAVRAAKTPRPQKVKTNA